MVSVREETLLPGMARAAWQRGQRREQVFVGLS